MFPGSDITQHKINMKNNDFDVFLLYALKKLDYYQDKLTKQEVKITNNIFMYVEICLTLIIINLGNS